MAGRERLKVGWWVLPSVALLTAVVDQLTKHLVVATLGQYDSWALVPVLSGWVDIHHVTNTGAAFGLFQSGSTVFVIISILVSVAILFYCCYLEDGQWLVRLSLGLQLGGATGNLIDRLRFGHVTDFIDVHMLPVFNVADAAIVWGVVLLVLLLLCEDRKDRKGVGPSEDKCCVAEEASSP